MPALADHNHKAANLNIRFHRNGSNGLCKNRINDKAVKTTMPVQNQS